MATLLVTIFTIIAVVLTAVAWGASKWGEYDTWTPISRVKSIGKKWLKKRGGR